MNKKPLIPIGRFWVVLWLFLICALPISFAFAADKTTSDKTQQAASDEAQIMKDRDQAVLDALELAKKKEHPGFFSKLKFWNGSEASSTKTEKKTKPSVVAPQASVKSSPAPIKENPKKETPSEVKSKTPQASKANWQEVMKKREERMERFPSLDPEQVQQSINKIKVDMKQGFLQGEGHTLDDVIARAIQVHLPAQIAYERVKLSERRIFKAMRNLFSSADFSRVEKGGTLQGLPFKSQNWRLAFKQPLFHGGVLWNTVRFEMANRDAARKELDKTVADLVENTSKAYFDYERAFNTVKDREDLFGSVQEQKRISDEKVKANLISEIEKLNIDSLTSQADFNLQNAKQELELSKLELQRVLELDFNDPINVKSLYDLNSFDLEKIGVQHTPAESSASTPADAKIMTEPGLTVEGKNVDQYIDMAYLNRADLQVEAAKLKASRISNKISAGKFLPEADLILELGQLGEVFVDDGSVNNLNELGTSKPPWNNEWRIGTELSWNLAGSTVKYTFDNDQRAPSISQFRGAQGTTTVSHTYNVSLLDDLGSLIDLRETKIAILEQVVQLDKTERDVVREVKEAYFNYNKALIQLESNYKRMEYREKLANLAKHRLDNNEIQISEYVQAKLDYDDERAQVHKALADFYLSKADLNKAIGIQNYLKIGPLQIDN